MKRFALLLLVFISLGTIRLTAQLTWNIFGELRHPRHYHHSLNLDDGKILVMGGYINSGGGGMSGVPTNICELIDVKSRSVNLTNPMIVARAEFVALYTKDSNIVVISGLSNSGLTPTCELFNRKTQQWQLVGSLKTARRQHVGVFINDNEILVVGGRHNNLVTMADAEIFNITTGTSRSIANFPYPINLGAININSNGDIIAGAGRSGGPDSYREKTIYKYDIANNVWTSKTLTRDPVHAGFLMKLANGRLLFTGGSITENFWSFSNQTLLEEQGEFRSLKNLRYNRTHHVAAQWSGDSVLVVGGYNSTSRRIISDCEWIDLSNGNTIGAPTLHFGRAFTSIVKNQFYDECNQNQTCLVISGLNNSGVNERTIEILEDAKPLAGFTFDTICAGQKMQYTDTSSSCVSSWKWEFQGGEPAIWSGEEPPSIFYKNAGSYVTTLTTASTSGLQIVKCTVTVRPMPIAEAGADISICPGGISQLGSNPVSGYQYYWWPDSGLDNSQIARPLVTKISSQQIKYYLKVTSEFGCEALDSVIVNAGNITVQSRDTTVCSGGTVQLFATGGSEYEWSPAQGLSATSGSTVFASPEATTLYRIIGKQGACRDTTFITVTVMEAFPAKAGGDRQLCLGESTVLGDTIGENEDTVSFLWTPSEGLTSNVIDKPIATPLKTTEYILTTTNTNGCISIDTVLVIVNDVPHAFAGNDTSVCAGTGLQLSATFWGEGLQFDWSPHSTLSNSTISNPIATPLKTTEYVVTVTNQAGCVAHDTVVITVGDILKVVASNDTAVCAGESVQLSAFSDDGVVFIWSPQTGLDNPNIANPTAKPAETTTYTVTAFKNGGLCSGVDSVRIEVLKTPEIETKDISLCEGGSGELFAESGEEIVSWSWTPATGLSDPNIQNPVVTALKSETYLVTARNVLGCETTKALRLEVAPKENITGVLKSDKGELEPGESTVVKMFLKAENSEGITSFKATISFDKSVFQFTPNSEKFLNGADNTWFLKADIIAPGELHIEANGQTPIASSEIAFGLTAYLAKQLSENILLKITEINGEEVLKNEACRTIAEESTNILLKEVCAGDMRLVKIGEFPTFLKAVTPNPATGETIDIEYSIGIEGNIALEIYNAQGELVKTVVDRRHAAGIFKETVSTMEINSGVFLVKLTTVQSTETRVISVVK